MKYKIIKVEYKNQYGEEDSTWYYDDVKIIEKYGQCWIKVLEGKENKITLINMRFVNKIELEEAKPC